MTHVHLLTFAKWMIFPGRPSSTDCSCKRVEMRPLNFSMPRLKAESGSCPTGYMRSSELNSLKIACMIIILFTRAREIASRTSLRSLHRERKLRRHTKSLPSTTVVMNEEKSVQTNIAKNDYKILLKKKIIRVQCVLSYLCRTVCPARSRACRRRSSAAWGTSSAGSAPAAPQIQRPENDPSPPACSASNSHSKSKTKTTKQSRT